MLTTKLQSANWPQTIEDFESLIEATQDELVHLAFYRLGNRDDAEDVVQDAYVRALRDRTKHRNVTGVWPYLFRMVGNRCIDMLRARSRRTGNAVTEEPAYDENGFSLLEARERAVFRPRPKETRPILKEDFYGHVGQATLHSIVPDAVLLSRRRRTTARQTKMAARGNPALEWRVGTPELSANAKGDVRFRDCEDWNY